MPVIFQVVGNLADFGNSPRAGVKVRATASPGVKVGDVAVHSNEPETVVTDEAGAFTLTLVSLPGVWYRIQTPYGSALGTINLAGYVPDTLHPTTGTVFPGGTVINIKDVVSENPNPGYEAVAFGGNPTIIPASRLRVWGHSYASGVGPGVDSNTQGLAAVAAAALDLPLSNLAVGGTVLYNNNSAASHWSSVLQAETRPTRFAPIGGAYAVMYGLNDLNYLGNTVAELGTFKMALRTVVARLRASAVFEDTHPSVTLGGSGAWQYASRQISNSGTRLAYNATAGATVTITTPADFPGGTVTLGFVNWNDGSGATVTGTVAGAVHTLNTAATSRTDAITPAVLRIPDVPAGSASYTFTSSDPVGGVGLGFDYWQWEPDESACPLVALIGQPKPLDYAGYIGDGSATDPTDAGVDALNAVQASLASEFGARVIVVDTSVLDHDPAYWTAGNIHPNVAGHALIGQKIAAAMSAKGTFLRADLAPSPAAWASYTPRVGGGGTSLGNGTSTGAYVRDDSGTVHFYTRLTLGSTTVFGSDVTIGLPVPMFAEGSASAMQAWATDAGMTSYTLGVYMGSTTDVNPIVLTGGFAFVAGGVPFTWTAPDVLEVRGTYRAA